MRGADIEIYNQSSGRAVDNIRGLHVDINQQSTGLVTTMYGIYVDVKQNSTLKPVTNSYGLFINSVLAADDTDAYGIYAAGGFYNYLNGNVGIGIARPTEALDVRGNSVIVGPTSATGGMIRLRGFFAANITSTIDPPLNQATIQVLDTGAAPALIVRYNDGGVVKTGTVLLV